jgi:hypothetical protein
VWTFVACAGERRGAYRGLLEKSEGKSHLADPGVDGNINIKMDLQEVGYEGTDWIDVAQNRDSWWALVNAVMNLWIS